MNEWTGSDEPTLASVQHEFPAWHCWRGVSGLYHGTHAGKPDGSACDVTGEDPRDLRDQIIRWKRLNQDRDVLRPDPS